MPEWRKIMSKIICDICGTSYPDTADQCPLCGTAKPEEPELQEQTSEDSYTYVKGGRFSKSNVRKRNKAKAAAPVVYPSDDEDYDDDADDDDEDEYEDDEPERSNKGLAIFVVVLLLAIAALVFYIYITYLNPDFLKGKPSDDPAGSTGVVQTTVGTEPETTTTPTTTPSTTPEETTSPVVTTPTTVACTGIELSANKITLGNVGDGYLMNFTLTPANTTDTVTYESSDPSVATVDANGKITAVSDGVAIVTVTCGEVTAQCTVTCNVEVEEVTEPSTEPTQPVAEIKLNRKDISFTKEGESWDLYDGNVGRNQVIFTSDDPAIATFKNGVVTAVSRGTTTVRAEFNGQKVSCIIRCNLPSTEEPTEPDDVQPDATQECTISSTDVTMAVGESFVLKLTDAEGKTVTASWHADKENIVQINGNTIKAVGAGTTTVTFTVGEKVYSCIIRVKASW